jgi:hypothetical protein
MATPVLIPARQEAEHIGRTLEALPRDVEPIVIPNGPEDATVRIAVEAGATVLSGSREGKIRALQHGVSYLGERAIEPFFILDADTRPFMPGRWVGNMLDSRGQMDTTKPGVIMSPYVFSGIDPLSMAWRNLGHWKWFIRTFHDPNHGATGNMLLDLHTRAARDDFMDLPNVWPKDDVAVRDLVLGHGGNVGKSFTPTALLVTDGSRFPGFLSRLRIGSEQNQVLLAQSYIEEAPADSVRYETVERELANIWASHSSQIELVEHTTVLV